MTSNSRDNAQGQPIDEVGESIGLLEDQNNPSHSQTETRPCAHRAREEGLRGRHLAPSGGNRQPWMFVAVTDPEKRAQIATLYREVFDAYIAPAVEAARDPGYPEAKRKNMRAAMYLRISMKRPYTFVMGWTRRGAPQSQALFPAIQNVLLACRAVVSALR